MCLFLFHRSHREKAEGSEKFITFLAVLCNQPTACSICFGLFTFLTVKLKVSFFSVPGLVWFLFHPLFFSPFSLFSLSLFLTVPISGEGEEGGGEMKSVREKIAVGNGLIVNWAFSLRFAYDAFEKSVR